MMIDIRLFNLMINLDCQFVYELDSFNIVLLKIVNNYGLNIVEVVIELEKQNLKIESDWCWLLKLFDWEFLVRNGNLI